MFRSINNPATTIPLDVLVSPTFPEIVFVNKDNRHYN